MVAQSYAALTNTQIDLFTGWVKEVFVLRGGMLWVGGRGRENIQQRLDPTTLRPELEAEPPSHLKEVRFLNLIEKA